MPNIKFKKDQLPFLLDGQGGFAVETGELAPAAKIPPDSSALLNVTFEGDGKGAVTLGQSQSVKLGLSTMAGVKLTPVFAPATGAKATLLKTYGLQDFFKSPLNGDKVVLCFEVSAAADASAATAFQYSALKATTTLSVGADAGYAYLRAI